jgi:hypothetical protein
VPLLVEVARTVINIDLSETGFLKNQTIALLLQGFYNILQSDVFLW